MANDRTVTLKMTMDAADVKSGADQGADAIRGVGAAAQEAGERTNTGYSRASQGAAAFKTAAQESSRAAQAALADLIGKIDPTIAALERLDQQEAKLRAFRAQGVIGSDDFTTYAQRIEASREALTSATGAAHSFSLANASVTREIGVMAGELARGNYTRLEGSMVTLANRTGLLSLAFSGAGVTIGAVGVVIASVIGLIVSGALEQRRYETALIATGNAAGKSAADLRNLAGDVARSTGEFSKSEQAVLLLAKSGKLSGDALTAAAQGAVSLSTITGESIEKAVQEFDKLADDPVKAVVKLSGEYHFLTGAMYDQIKALQDQGRTEEATTLAVKDAADAMNKREKSLVDSAGAIERAWRQIKSAVGEAAESIKNFGRTDDQAQLQHALDKQDAIMATQAARSQGLGGRLGAGFNGGFGVAFSDDALQSMFEKNQALINSINTRIQAQRKADEEAGRQTHLADAEVKAQEALDATNLRLDKQAEKQKAIQDLNAQFKALFDGPSAASNPRLAGVSQTDDGFTGGLYSKALSEINEKYSDHGKAARAAAAEDAALAAAMKRIDDMTDSLSGKLDKTAEAQAVFNKGMRQAQADAEAAYKAGGDVNVIIEKWQKNEELLRADLAKTNAEIAKRNVVTNGNKDLVIQLGQQHDKLLGLTAAQVAYNKASEDAAALATKAIADGQAEDAVAAGLEDRLKKLAELRDGGEIVSIVEQFGSKTEFERLVEDLGKVRDALTKATDPAIVERLNVALGNIRQKMIDGIVTSSQQGLRSLQTMTTDGSKAFEAFQIAIDALTLVQAISAVLNQGQGDPYSAFARMAAMAAAVVALGVDIGNFNAGGGPSAQSAEVRQKTQGTGSVLGDPQAQSDSIAKATDITANAVTQLVGLNRGMLTALQALQNALGAAGNQLARGAGDAQFPALKGGNAFNNAISSLDPLGGDPITKGISSLLFGGSKKVIDQGILIAGGTLKDMLNNIVVGAYQTVKTSGGLFGGGGTKDQLAGVSADFSKQFELVISSIADTVRAGALALGLLPADVEAAMASYQVAATRISLSGLSSDDKQKALEAVFSSIFDGLAGAVVPFIGEFQKVGEGLGETLVRVATEVQVSQEAFKELGITVKETDPEKFAKIADGLVNAAGGLDAFISSMRSFVDKFAPDSEKFKFEADSLASGFSQVGLTLPTTREGMYALMQSLDATTEAGRAQIAMLLKLTDTSDAYYSDLERRAASLTKYSDFVANLAGQDGKLSGFAQSRLQIEQWERDTIKQANELAKAAGLQGASEQDLTLIHEIAAHKIADAIAALVQSSADLVTKLYGSGDAVTDTANSSVSAINTFTGAMTSAGEAAQQAAQLMLGALSPLNDQQKLQYALQAYQRGEVNKEDVLNVGRRLYASSQKYTDLFNMLQTLPGGIAQNNGGGDVGGSYSATSNSTASTLTPEEIERQRHADANTLAQNIASLSNAQEESYADVAKELHLNLNDLAKDLNLSGDQLNNYLDHLKDQENAIPDSVTASGDKIIAAMYDIAGLTAPTPVDSSTATTSITADKGTAIDVGATGSTRPVKVSAPEQQPQSAAQADQTNATLQAVKDLLDKILAATKDGNEKLVGLGEETIEVTASVASVLQRTDDQSGADVRRNVRPIAP